MHKSCFSAADFDAGQWNALAGTENPFLSHEFLDAMESSHSASPENGWQSCFQATWKDNKIQAACPLYIKGNSHGEFVFDWNWASFYQQLGLPYYPKLVVAPPYSPVPGQRLLGDESAFPELYEGCLELAFSLHASSLHWNFLPRQQADWLDNHDSALVARCQWQYHWFNRGYGDFSEFLATLKSRKRKKIRQERQAVTKSGFDFVRKNGSEANEAELDFAYAMYTRTFDLKGNFPALTRSFFQQVAKQGKLLLVIASLNGSACACAIFFESSDTLYGRYWGSLDESPGLHFETCYYQGIEYCIEKGLERFEPGAQGMHKIARGFVPVLTHSRHWLANTSIAEVIRKHCDHESQLIQQHGNELKAAIPYREYDDFPSEF